VAHFVTPEPNTEIHPIIFFSCSCHGIMLSLFFLEKDISSSQSEELIELALSIIENLQKQYVN